MGVVVSLLWVLGGVAMLAFVTSIMGWFATGIPPRLLRRPVAWLDDHVFAPRRAKTQPLPPVLLGLELRRLADDLRRVDAGDQPAKAARLAASRCAYDYVLMEYCRALEIEVPVDLPPLSAYQRMNAETALISAGADW